ncbi:unnamed protein product, partial [Sphacelaria rigidula]
DTDNTVSKEITEATSQPGQQKRGDRDVVETDDERSGDRSQMRSAVPGITSTDPVDAPREKDPAANALKASSPPSPTPPKFKQNSRPSHDQGKIRPKRATKSCTGVAATNASEKVEGGLTVFDA